MRIICASTTSVSTITGIAIAFSFWPKVMLSLMIATDGNQPSLIATQ